MAEERKITGYPSIDKPWIQYYSDGEKNLTIPDGSMYDYLFQCNRDYPNDIAIEYYGSKTTFRELFQKIDQCCRNLSALGIQKGEIVTVQTIPLPQAVVLIYALTRIGACGNMLFPDVSAADVVHSMEKTRSKLLISVDKIFETYEKQLPASFNKQIILMNVTDEMALIPSLLAKKKTAYTQSNQNLNVISWKDFMKGSGLDYPESHDENCPAFMLRTGGTTGVPKEVVLCSKGFNAIAHGVFYRDMCGGWKRQDTNILLLPPFIAFGIGSGIHHSFCYGMKTRIVLDVSPAAMSKLLNQYKPNYIMAGTMQVEQIMTDLNDSDLDLSFIKLINVGGEGISNAYEEKLRAFAKAHHCNAVPLKGYGLTESSGGAACETIKAKQIGSVGIPMSLFNMKVVDPDTGKELTYNTPGEICISTAGVMLGYYQDQQATDEMIETVNGERWLHTGDIGVISEAGLLTITGRIKRIITCKEGIIYHKVFPKLLEDQLSMVDGIKDISIVGRSSRDVGNELIAFVVPESSSDFEAAKERLEAYCAAHLQTYETPVEYRCLNNLPRTMIGKVNYRALEKLAEEMQQN